MALLTTRLPRAWAAAARHPQVADALLGAFVSAVSLCAALVVYLAAVENRADPGGVAGPGARAGHGLTGMRERAASVGGTLDAGLDAGGRFAVHAFLPVPVSQEVPT